MIKLCVFDFDSTLMDGETITEFARSVGKEKEVADITKRAMAGELDFFESLVKSTNYKLFCTHCLISYKYLLIIFSCC